MITSRFVPLQVKRDRVREKGGSRGRDTRGFVPGVALRYS